MSDSADGRLDMKYYRHILLLSGTTGTVDSSPVPTGQVYVIEAIQLNFNATGSGGWVLVEIVSGSTAYMLFGSAPATSTYEKEWWTGKFAVHAGEKVRSNAISGQWDVAVSGFYLPQYP